MAKQNHGGYQLSGNQFPRAVALAVQSEGSQATPVVVSQDSAPVELPVASLPLQNSDAHTDENSSSAVLEALRRLSPQPGSPALCFTPAFPASVTLYFPQHGHPNA
ncbi:UNVERIFIED_CONTAM: hypothetical protein FKN15_028238 [Acipenser sinensis]